ncbi:phosphate ABC transporter permease PstA [Bifidobacterium jacchi]|uniref:Phosphate transport system permease protein PstA n=1 Tax=Bifidobacterium jacchi TaxID=2490545 RepID=A0A5N5RG90_9BIFI|nr:phosphate ABC transporter permease PstA [Bifidobacterium jacchi]KAB5606243.1 phosphate ABC transporter permease PstA [Bifidobacterium jacchi]
MTTVTNSAIKTGDDGSIKFAPKIDFTKFQPTRSSVQRRKFMNGFMYGLIVLAFVIVCIPLISVLWSTISSGVQRLTISFLSDSMNGVIGGKPLASGSYGGVFHAIIGTLEITLGAMIISIPIGLMCSVYLVEYARGSKTARTISSLVDVMSGIPSIVAGLFAYSLFTLVMGPGFYSGFQGSVALSILMIPTVVKTSEEMIKIVPNDLREASYALGVTKQRTITKIVLRTALPGIVSGAILAIARVIGETAPLLIAAGLPVKMNYNLFDGQMATLPVYVYKQFAAGAQTCFNKADASCVPEIAYQRSWSAALVLIIIVLVLNLIGRLVEKLFAVKTEQ